MSCENCSLSELYLPRDLGRDAMERLDAIVRRTRPLHKGDRLFTRLQVLKPINVERRMVSILDRPGLQELSHGACAEETASRGSAA